MDESALRIALASLDDCSSSLHWWLGFWTFLVALGVALEIVFVVWEYIEDLRDCRRSLLYPPVKPNLSLFVLGFFGAALVAAGVAGEVFVESKIATAETCIRKGNDQLSLLLSKEANDAATSAKTAHDEADAVKDIADEARADAKDALAKARLAQSELANAESDAAKAQTAAVNVLSTSSVAASLAESARNKVDAAQQKLESLQQQLAVAQMKLDTLTGKLADRELTDLQVKLIRGKLLPFRGQTFQMSAYWDNPEAKKIALRIGNDVLVNGSGWTFVPYTTGTMLMGGIVGVQVRVHSDADSLAHEAANTLASSLTDNGIPAEAKDGGLSPGGANKNMITINVGSNR